MIVYEYFTTSTYDAFDRITGYQQFNTATFPEKEVFAKNAEPTPEMNVIGGFFDEDGLPQFILFDNGVIEKKPVPENIKKKLFAVVDKRFKRDYGNDKMQELTAIMIAEGSSNHPDILEFKRRKKEVDDLKAAL
jgi:hypothetical protein